MKRILLTLLFLLGASGVKLKAQTEIGDEECYAMFVDLGKQKYTSGKYTHAVFLLSAAGSCPDRPKEDTLFLFLTTNKTCAKYIYKGDAKYESGKYDAAIQYYKLVIATNPTDRHAIGRIKVCEDKLEGATE